MSMLPPVFVELKANVTEFTAAMGEARGEMMSVEAQGMSSFDKLAGFGKAALFGLGAAAVGVGVMGVEMADKFEASHAKLEQALKNAGTNFEKFKEPIDKAQKSMETYGFTNAQTQEALGNLTTALKDPQKALDDLSLAADLAKYKHIDLADAATAVARAQEGNLRALKQLGIDLPITATSASKLAASHDALSKATDAASTFLKSHSDATDASSKSHAAYEILLGKVEAAQKKVNDQSSAGKEIMKGLADAIGGQAAAQAETFSGKMQALKATSEDVVKNIGMALIPILEKLMEAIKGVIDFFKEHKLIAEEVAVVLGTVLVAAITAYLVSLAKAAVESVINFGKMIAGWVATGAAATASAAEATAAGIAANLATGGMVLAIGLLVTAIVYLGTHWSETWDGVKEVTKIAWDWIKEKIDFISGLFSENAPLGIALAWLGQTWSMIWDGIKDATSAASNFIDGVVKVIGNGIKGFIGLIKGEINGLISLVNTAIKAIDAIHVTLPKFLGGGSIGFNIPTIPLLAEGGIVTSPTLAMIGEAGSEAVIPLSKMGNMGGGINVVIHVQGSVIKEQDLAVTVRDGIAQLMRRRGLNPSILGV